MLPKVYIMSGTMDDMLLNWLSSDSFEANSFPFNENLSVLRNGLQIIKLQYSLDTSRK